MRTLPVNQSAGPREDGSVPLRLISMNVLLNFACRRSLPKHVRQRGEQNRAAPASPIYRSGALRP